MKILQLVQKPQLRGAEVFATQLAANLTSEGHSCLVVAIFEGDGKLSYPGRLITLGRPLNKRLFDVTGWRALAMIIEDECPEIVQANAGDTLKFAVFSKALFGWRARLVFRNANKISDFVTTPWKRWFNAILIRRVNAVISVSERCREDFVALFGERRPVVTVPIGTEVCDISRLDPALSHLYSRGPVLVHVGSFVPEKNHHGLLRVFSQVKKQVPTAQLLLVGSGRLENEVRRCSEELQLAESVHFLGNRTDVLSVLSAAQVFVLPSLIEGLPGVILEAMYARVPVVANDVGGVSEVVIPETTGQLIIKGDEKAFVDAVVDVLKDRSGTSAMVERAYDFLKENFDNRVIARRFAKVYASILQT